MSKLEDIKNKVRNAGSAAVHNQLIDTTIIEDDKQKNSANEHVNVHVNAHVNAVPKVRKKRVKKPKFEDTYTRDTIWIRKDLKELIHKECAGERGEKTRIINEALLLYFQKMSEES